MDHARLAGWTGLVAVIAALNYYGRFSGSKSSGNEVYHYSTFASGMVVYLIGSASCSGSRRATGACSRYVAPLHQRAAGLAVAAVVAIYVLEAIVSVIPLPESPGKEQGLTPTHWEPAHAGAFAANIVLFAVVAPIVEELTFRGLGQSLLAFLGQWPSILLVGLAFGLAHGLVEALLVLVPFGIALAWLRNRTDSVYPGMVVHALFNGVALAAAVLT